MARSVDFGVSPSFTLWIDATHLLRGDVILDTDCVQTGTWASGREGQVHSRQMGDRQYRGGEGLGFGMAHGRRAPQRIHGIRYRRQQVWRMDRQAGRQARNMSARDLVPVESAWCGLDGKESKCWNVTDGKEIRLGHGIGGYQFTDPAASAPRVIAEHSAYPSFFACFPLCQSELRRRAVWDFSTRTLVSSWKPNAQAWNSIHRQNEPDRCSLSSDGQFVAEGGDGVVRLYRLTP